ncbi:MAG: methyltransferase domain-containing protein [Planctomycetes bacterium]|nr:methyltransferase domain-containing protein [Planctomycetota bacterium]
MRSDRANRTPVKWSGASLGGAAILLEIGAEYGVVDVLRSGEPFDARAVAEAGGLSEGRAAKYLDALRSAGLVEAAEDGPGGKRVRGVPELDDLVNAVGYVAWSLRACAPLIDHARDFARDLGSACATYPRDGGLVGRTSRWMGEQDFYPQAERVMLDLRPKRIVDLGSGVGRLLIKMLRALPDASGVGVDISAGGCEQARAAARAAGMEDRIQIYERSIQSLGEDPSPLRGADVIHAGWVFHELLPEDERYLDELLVACRTTASTGTLVIVEGVPYASAEDERMFSAGYSYLHDSFMSRRLLPEEEWRRKLAKAGFARVDVATLGIPGGRLFAARAK